MRGYFLKKYDDDTFDDRCTKCSENCAECVNSADRCTKCKKEFELSGTKCKSLLRCSWNYTFNTDCDAFKEDSSADLISDKIAEITNSDSEDISIKEVACGSVMVSGDISINNANQASTIQQDLQAGQNSFPYEVISSSIGLYYGDEPYTEQ